MPAEPLQGLRAWPVEWPAPPSVRAFMSTRHGGVSEGAYGSLNLGLHVGDDAACVYENRRLLAQHMGTKPLWLQQVHGNNVVAAGAVADGTAGPADGVWASEPNQACAILVADCLPVLFCSADGQAVAAAHAGWRGLAGGVLEATARAVTQAAGSSIAELHAWLGPCIGPRQFEVGDDVLEAFGPSAAARFQPHRRSDGSKAWFCDLAGLAEDRLRALGLHSVHGRRACTVEQASDFFSFRRERVTGRMAAVVLIEC